MAKWRRLFYQTSEYLFLLQPSSGPEATKDGKTNDDTTIEENRRENEEPDPESNKTREDEARNTEEKSAEKTEAELNSERLNKMIDGDFEGELDKFLDEKDWRLRLTHISSVSLLAVDRCRHLECS